MRPHVIVPTRRNVRFHQWLAGLTLLFGLATMTFSFYAISHGGLGRVSPLGAVGYVVSAIGGILMLRSLSTTLAHQHRRLRTHGKKYRAERAGVEQMERGTVTHFHVVVAHFRTDRGALQEALSETFDYDPGPLLDVRGIEIIADPCEPALCVVDNDTLPPRALRQLTDRQRRELGTLSRRHHALLVGGTIIAVAMFVYGAVQLLRLRY